MRPEIIIPVNTTAILQAWANEYWGMGYRRVGVIIIIIIIVSGDDCSAVDSLGFSSSLFIYIPLLFCYSLLHVCPR